jgi:hypothetical protein
MDGGQYQKTEKSVPSIAIREPRGVTRRTSDVDLETRGFSAKRRPHVSERVFRPPRVPGTPRALRVAVSKGGGRAKKTHRARLHPRPTGRFPSHFQKFSTASLLHYNFVMRSAPVISSVLNFGKMHDRRPDETRRRGA